MKEDFVSELQDIQLIHKQMVLVLKQQHSSKQQQDQVIFNLESNCARSRNMRVCKYTWGQHCNPTPVSQYSHQSPGLQLLSPPPF